MLGLIEDLKQKIKKRIVELEKTIGFPRPYAEAKIEELEIVLEKVGVLEQKLQDEILPLLEPIIRKSGAFSQDPLTHAENCLELASENASKILKVLGVEEKKK